MAALVLCGVSLGIWLSSGTEAQEPGPSGRAFDTIEEKNMSVDISFTRVDPSRDPSLLSESELRSLLGPAMNVPMRESPKLVQVVKNPFGVDGVNGPLWAVLPDLDPVWALGPIPAGVKTYWIQLYDARSGELVVEFGGPVVDGQNEWHPEVPAEDRNLSPE
jgi:hypothetical protein